MPKIRKVCAKCDKELQCITRIWIHKTHEDFQNCGRAWPKPLKVTRRSN